MGEESTRETAEGLLQRPRVAGEMESNGWISVLHHRGAEGICLMD